MSLPYFPLYPTDFEADTSHLTLEEDGAYNRLLRLMWMTAGCSLPDDDAWIARRMRVDAETFKRVVLVVLDEFFVRANGRVSNARLIEEFEKSSAAHKRRVEAGSKGGKSKPLKTKGLTSSKAQAKPKQPEPEPEPEPNITTSSTAEIGNQPDLSDLSNRLLAAIGPAGNQAATGLVSLHRPLAWLEAGCDLEQDILPTLKTVAGRQLQKLGAGCIGTWGYFDNPVMQAKAERLKPLPKMETGHATRSYNNQQQSRSGEKRSAHLTAISAAGDQISRDRLAEQDYPLISEG